ncbi:carboxylesterase type B [Sphingomonas sp. BE270]|jgi:hypothetical protein|uniref:hypothetical protein n=1 Tax=Sphingomonas sp. BE270 TaxID=2817726 RepID=UPI002864E094|nr:hypothetical protein [Sphingomonas sp. BE270]MDR7257824.1 carboxylesterase type B [Sphingomonas sp. BE270]
MAEADPKFSIDAAIASLALPWTERADARAILASFATEPTSRATHRQTFGRVRDEWHSYDDSRADQLEAIRTDALTAILETETLMTREQFRGAISAQPHVTAAIDAALNGDAA